MGSLRSASRGAQSHLPENFYAVADVIRRINVHYNLAEFYMHAMRERWLEKEIRMILKKLRKRLDLLNNN